MLMVFVCEPCSRGIVDRILLMLWAVGFIFSAFFTLGTLILTLCLKGKARSVGVNFLLLFATCNIFMIAVVPYLSLPKAPGKEQDAKLADGLKKWSRTLDEACRIEYAQKQYPALRIGTILEFPFRDPTMTFSEEIDGSDLGEHSYANDEIMETIVGLTSEHTSKERTLKINAIEYPILNQLPPGWLKDEALRFNAIYSDTPNPKYVDELEQKRTEEGERFAPVMALYTLYYLAVVISGLVVVSNAVLWLKTADKAPNPAILLTASARTVYSVFVIAIYGSMVMTIPSEIFNFIFKESISKVSATAVSSLCGCLGIFIGSLVATKALILDKAGLTIREAFPLQVAPAEWPLRIMQAFLTFVASTSLSSIVFIIQWNLCGPIGTKNAFNISLPQLASDFHIEAVILNTVAIAIIAPISEELLCRGLLFGWLRRRHSLYVAAIISAFFFALIHLDVQLLPSLFVVGFVFAISYERTGSLVPNMLGHALHNCAVLLSVFLVR